MNKWEKRQRLYALVEEAVRTKSELRLEDAVMGAGYSVEIGNNYFLLPDLYWMDDCRNVYQVWCRIEAGPKLGFPGLFVVGTVALDGLSSGDLSMIKPENRYKTII